MIIIGGSYAGLSAALVLGRSRRNVLVIDSGQPANRQTPHSHSFLTRDGATPAELSALAREQALAYPTVRLLNGTVSRATALPSGFCVATADNQEFRAGRLVLATGLADVLPSIPGIAECWGISVLHCPYCHGYEVSDKTLGVLANGDEGFEFARLIHHWSRNLTLFTNGPSTLTGEQSEKLKTRGIAIVETPLVAVPHQQGQLSGLRLANQPLYPLDALFARATLRQASDLAHQLGCTHNTMGFVEVDEFGKTSVKGVYAAGDTHTGMRQVLVAGTNGLKAAVMINAELIAEAF